MNRLNFYIHYKQVAAYQGQDQGLDIEDPRLAHSRQLPLNDAGDRFSIINN